MKTRFFPPYLACTLLAGALVSESQAGTEFFWSADASTGNLGTGGNWDGGTAPATATNPTTSQNTDILVFTNAAMAGALIYGGHRNLGGIEFRGAEVGSYTLATGTANPRMNMTLGGRISMDADVTVPQSVVRIGFSGAAGSYTIENLATSPDATLTVANTTVNYSTQAMTMILGGSNTGHNTINNAISESTGSGALTLEKNGPGSWVISASNSHTGGTILQEGTLGLRNSNPFGSGPLTINGGTIGSVVTARSLANQVTINGDFQLGGVSVPGLSNQATTFNGTVDLGGGIRTITLGNSATFSNTVSNGGLVIEALANATLTLSGTSTYSGDTIVSSGTLFLTGALGAGDVTVEAGATIRGGGTISGSLSFDAGATLDVTGATLGESSTGILSVGVNSTITLTDFGFASITGWDWATAGEGIYTLINGGDEVILAGSTPTEANPFNFGGGRFGYFQGGSLQAVIIPEPAAALLGSLGLLALLRRRRA